jgi:glycosyltransferase involved in cell wall biosynthesis
MVAKRSKVMFLTTGLTFGGAENLLCQVAARLKNNGWDVSMVSMTPPEAFEEELSRAGIPLELLGMKKGVPDPRAIMSLAKIVRRRQPDILHSHMVHANLLARVARPMCRVPVLITTAHNITEGARWREIGYRLTDCFADLTTQVSEAGVERYIAVKAVRKEKIICVPNGVDVSLFRPDREAGRKVRAELGLGGGFVWLAVGRLKEAKDYPNMLRALAVALKEFPEMQLLIAGQGPLQEDIERLAHELGIAEKVRLLGIRKDMPELMNAVDGYLMSSAWEGMPNVLLEASASSLPVVATDVGGNREIVGDGGLLVQAGDSPALAEAMLRLMRMPAAERMEMGEAGRAYIVKNYSLEKIVDIWEKLYVEILAKKA